jgi:Zn-dependent protease
MDYDLASRLVTVLLTAPVFLFSLVFHEYAHALVAYRLGDRVAAWTGRLTLDPRAHIDPIGSIVMPIAGLLMGGFIFGWAKPVPFDPRNLKNPARDTMLIALAGPASNVLLLLAFAGLLRGLGASGALHGNGGLSVLGEMAMQGLFVNAILAAFNMIPLPPLDGSKALAFFLPPRTAYALLQFNPMYSFLLIIVLVQMGLLSLPLSVLMGLGQTLAGIA